MTPPTSGFLVRIPVLSVPPIPPRDAEHRQMGFGAGRDSRSQTRLPVMCLSISGVVAAKRHRGAADQLSVSIGEHERFSAAGRSNVATRSANQPRDSHSRRRCHICSNLPQGVGNPVVSAWQFGPSSGMYGLGQQAAWANVVRPYRSLISAQAIYRREVFLFPDSETEKGTIMRPIKPNTRRRPLWHTVLLAILAIAIGGAGTVAALADFKVIDPEKLAFWRTRRSIPGLDSRSHVRSNDPRVHEGPRII